MKKIAVLVSGGVDSSIALRLLKDEGHELTAFYLKIWLEDELSFLGQCPWQEDLHYVEAVCQQAVVPLRVINLQKEYQEQIVAYTLAEVKAGRTPNPDILCNRRIKFGVFFDQVIANYEVIATGHYARVAWDGDTAMLFQTPDTIKDQTYFLSHLSQEQLKKLVFPLGNLTKQEVRALAQQYDLPNKDRKDSQGLCFLGKIKFDEFIKYHLGELPGAIIEYETGKELGKHPGFYFYTLGQRQGLRLAGGPWYVVKKDPVANKIFVSRSYYDADKPRNVFTVTSCNWVRGRVPNDFTNLTVKLRHGPQQYTCCVTPHQNGDLLVELTEHDQGIAPGQFAALYDGTECLGSGVIKE
jgi:tRNA (5-methylaminomethyl-2-thiouridylate)-methyltransferase